MCVQSFQLFSVIVLVVSILLFVRSFQLVSVIVQEFTVNARQESLHTHCVWLVCLVVSEYASALI